MEDVKKREEVDFVKCDVEALKQEINMEGYQNQDSQKVETVNTKMEIENEGP